jgi:hypothetical protein
MLASYRSAQHVKPFRERVPDTKRLTQIKRLLVAEDDKQVTAGTKAANSFGHPASIHTAQRRNK